MSSWPWQTLRSCRSQSRSIHSQQQLIPQRGVGGGSNRLGVVATVLVVMLSLAFLMRFKFVTSWWNQLGLCFQLEHFVELLLWRDSPYCKEYGNALVGDFEKLQEGLSTNDSQRHVRRVNLSVYNCDFQPAPPRVPLVICKTFTSTTGY